MQPQICIQFTDMLGLQYNVNEIYTLYILVRSYKQIEVQMMLEENKDLLDLHQLYHCYIN